MDVNRWKERFVLVFIFSSLSLLSCHLVCVDATNITDGIHSDEMYRAVWKGYEKSVRPLCSSPTSPSVVSMSLALRQLQELNEPKQILATNLWIRVFWTECRLTWTMDQWNVTRLVVPYNILWTPDLTLYDNAEEKLEGLSSYRLSVSSTGEVSQQFPVVAKSLCQLDVSAFPFDTQTCNLTFGSWAYHGYEVNLTVRDKAVNLNSYITHGEWELVALTGQRVVLDYDGIPYPQVIFTLVVRRRHLFYILSLLFPGALIHMMAILGFLLPCESNEKVGLVITVLLSLAVMQLVILDLIPPSSETLPIIGVYFTLSMGVVSVSCLMTVIVLAVNYPNRHRPVPHWAKAALDSKAARWLGVDINSLQQIAKMHSEGKTKVNAGPDVTLNTAASTQHRHNRTNHQVLPPLAHPPFRDSSTTTTRGAKTEELEMTSVVDLSGGGDGGTSGNNNPNPASDLGNHVHHLDHHLPADVSAAADLTMSNPFANASSSDSEVSFYYGTEGDKERRKRVCYRPLSADGASLEQILEDRQDQFLLHPLQWELHEMLRINRLILDCMKSGKKGPDHQKEKASNKLSRREWELLAVFLDRIFLIVFCLLSVIVFVYTYTTIAK